MLSASSSYRATGCRLPAQKYRLYPNVSDMPVASGEAVGWLTMSQRSSPFTLAPPADRVLGAESEVQVRRVSPNRDRARRRTADAGSRPAPPVTYGSHLSLGPIVDAVEQQLELAEMVFGEVLEPGTAP